MPTLPAKPDQGKPIPMARPAPTPALAKPVTPIPVSANAEEAAQAVPVPSRWEMHGWSWSILAHATLLLILGLWYLAPKASQVRTFDTRIAGSDNGVEEGVSNLGALNNPVSMPEAPPTTPDTSMTRLKTSEITAPVLAGLAGNPGAGNGDGFGLAKFGNGGETVRGVAVKVGDPQFTLLWDTKADIDIHVIEPTVKGDGHKEGKEIFWNDPRGRHGGELDVDNIEGYGPENVYWLKVLEDGSKDLGPGPAGEYKWYVHYYGGNGGVPVATRWKVRIKHEGRVEIIQGKLSVPGAKSKIYTLSVGAAESTAKPAISGVQ